MIHWGGGYGVLFCCGRCGICDRCLLICAICVFALSELENIIGNVGFKCIWFYIVVDSFEVDKTLAVVDKVTCGVDWVGIIVVELVGVCFVYANDHVVD